MGQRIVNIFLLINMRENYSYLLYIKLQKVNFSYFIKFRIFIKLVKYSFVNIKLVFMIINLYVMYY